MKTDTIDLLTRLTSRELRERLCQLAAQEKSVRVLLQARLSPENVRSWKCAAETERKGAVGERWELYSTSSASSSGSADNDYPGN